MAIHSNLLTTLSVVAQCWLKLYKIYKCIWAFDDRRNSPRQFMSFFGKFLKLTCMLGTMDKVYQFEARHLLFKSWYWQIIWTGFLEDTFHITGDLIDKCELMFMIKSKIHPGVSLQAVCLSFQRLSIICCCWLGINYVFIFMALFIVLRLILCWKQSRKV